MTEMSDLEVEAAVQRIRHMAAVLETSANKFEKFDGHDFSIEAATSLFRKVGELHRSLAESCRQQLAAWAEVEIFQIDQRKRLHEIEQQIARMKAEFFKGDD